MTDNTGEKVQRPAIYAECENCGHGYRWIPASVERQLAQAQAENERLREALHHIAIIGDTVEIVPTCHWHVEAATIAKTALSGSTEGASDGR